MKIVLSVCSSCGGTSEKVKFFRMGIYEALASRSNVMFLYREPVLMMVYQ